MLYLGVCVCVLFTVVEHSAVLHSCRTPTSTPNQLLLNSNQLYPELKLENSPGLAGFGGGFDIMTRCDKSELFQ